MKYIFIVLISYLFMPVAYSNFWINVGKQCPDDKKRSYKFKAQCERDESAKCINVNEIDKSKPCVVVYKQEQIKRLERAKRIKNIVNNWDSLPASEKNKPIRDIIED